MENNVNEINKDTEEYKEVQEILRKSAEEYENIQKDNAYKPPVFKLILIGMIVILIILIGSTLSRTGRTVDNFSDKNINVNVNDSSEIIHYSIKEPK